MWVPIGFALTGIQYLQTGVLNMMKEEIYISPTLVDGLEEDPSRQFEI